MAMARQMGRPSSPPFALIIVVLLLVIAIGVAVAIYIDRDKQIAAKQDAVAAEQKARTELNTATDKYKILQQSIAPASGTDDRGKAELDSTLSSIVQNLGSSDGNTFKDYKATDALKQLDTKRKQHYQEAEKYRGEKEALESDAKDLRVQLSEATKQLDQIKNEDAAARTSILNSYEKDLAALRTENSSLGDKLKAEQDTVTALRIQITALREEMDRQKTIYENKIRELEIKLRKTDPTLVDKARWSTTKLPDGHVVQVYPESKTVYLRLRSTDQARLGMRYLVHAKGEELPSSGKSKAVVEITSIEKGVQARIIKSTAGDPILSGDQVYNLVTGPVVYNFVTFGEFDLDNNGVFEPNGKAQIDDLLTKWGGKVQDEIDITTNFVILGVAPAVPPRPPADADPLVQENWRRKVEERTKWTRLHDTALKYSIPVMNEETFLTFIGYYPDGTNDRPGENYFQP